MRKWRCTVCGYIHEGPEPPDVCPVCGAPKEAFEEVLEESEASSGSQPAQEHEPASGLAPPTPEKIPTGPSALPVAPLARDGDVRGALYSLSYGLFIVTSRNNGRFNGQACNTVIQVTSEPARIALAINKQNLTHEFITASQVLAVTVLGKDNLDLARRFGFQSGRNVDKFAGLDYAVRQETGCPVLSQGIAFLEARLVPGLSVDAGTHTVFVADVLSGGVLRQADPMTYKDYRELKNKPASQPTAGPDRQNIIAALNLEYGANRRYQYQIERSRDPKLISVLRGVMLTEGDHVENSLRYLARGLKQDGWSWILLNLKLNLEFEETARDTYLKFASEAKDPEVARIFRDQAQSEQGHVNIFRELIKEIEEGARPVYLHCPLCGWEMDFGVAPEAGKTIRCPKCGAVVEVVVEDGQWTARLYT